MKTEELSNLECKYVNILFKFVSLNNYLSPFFLLFKIFLNFNTILIKKFVYLIKLAVFLYFILTIQLDQVLKCSVNSK